MGGHKWFPYTRGTIHLHRAALLLKGIALFGAKYNGPGFKSTLYINIGPKLWWAWDENEMNDVGKRIIERTRTEDGKKRHFDLMKELFDRAIKSSDNVRRTDLTKLNDKELAGIYKEHQDEVYECFGFLNVDIDAVDIWPVEFLKQKIKEELGPDNDLNSIYNDLTAPAYKTFVNEQEEIVLNIIKKQRSDKLESDMFEKGDYSGIRKELDKLMEDFWWTSLGWENMNQNTEEKFVELIKGALVEVDDADKAIKDLQESADRIRQRREKLIEKHGFSDKIRYWLGFFDEYSFWHDRRKEMQVKTIYSSYLILLEVAKRREYDPDDLEWLWHYEITSLLEGKDMDREEVEKRKKAVAVLVEGKNIQQWSGDEALKIFNKEAGIQQHDLKEIRGQTANAGKAKGIARVCAGTEEAISKVQKGDILVCGMTLPDYVPAVKRAAAIVTDEGGITCHAAIVSRELGVPCIIGTKIATQAIKDGDIIEVDAEKGIVRKIK